MPSVLARSSAHSPVSPPDISPPHMLCSGQPNQALPFPFHYHIRHCLFAWSAKSGAAFGLPPSRDISLLQRGLARRPVFLEAGVVRLGAFPLLLLLIAGPCTAPTSFRSWPTARCGRETNAGEHCVNNTFSRPSAITAAFRAVICRQAKALWQRQMQFPCSAGF